MIACLLFLAQSKKHVNTNVIRPRKTALMHGIVIAPAALTLKTNYAAAQALLVRKRSLLLLLWASAAFSLEPADVIKDPFRYPLYAGGTGGYGATTWGGLVPSESNQNVAISLSAPTLANEGGAVWGLFAGYEFSPYFAIEANYMRYPDATLTFDEMSLFAFDHDDRITLVTHTDTASLAAKIMLVIPRTTIRAFSSAGVAEVRRTDEINEIWRVTPTFGVGFNYNLNAHTMLEITNNYTAGYGESEINPVKDYVPFLYSVSLKLAYRL